jgi:hypothetical protein
VQPQPHCSIDGSAGHSANSESYAAPVAATSSSSGPTSLGPTHQRPPPLEDSDLSGRRTTIRSNGSSAASPSLQAATAAGIRGRNRSMVSRSSRAMTRWARFFDSPEP